VLWPAALRAAIILAGAAALWLLSEPALDTVDRWVDADLLAEDVDGDPTVGVLRAGAFLVLAWLALCVLGLVYLMWRAWVDGAPPPGGLRHP
jgi:hypothetical protein